ncbi:aldo/keto reductase [Amnibacterium endophyticum]|uniref:Aldo/keto reductase n=1 Tax=Amnibacterium endophyticum TaxID=2109337 RepID=A0ABW4LA69_9MICO
MNAIERSEDRDRIHIGVGTANLRSLGRRSSIRDVATLLRAAVELGATTIDTADTYGAGSAERALAAAAAGVGSRDLRVITKGGYVFPDLPMPLRPLNQPAKKLVGALVPRQRFDAAHLRRAWSASRERLQGLPVHAYCLHNPPASVLRAGEAVQVLDSLRASGAFDMVGVSVDDTADAALLPDLDGLGLVELSAHTWRELPAAARARLKGRGIEIVINRALHLHPDPATALQMLTAMDQAPDVIIVGTRNPAHLAAAVEAVA